MRKRTWISLVIAIAVIVALGVALYLRAKAPPEAARLLPESDAIVYFDLKPLRTATHFDQNTVTRSPDFQHFIDATGIVPERDLDSVAFALHSMPDPRGPNGPVAYSEVFIGRFDGQRLHNYLESIASAHETYADHEVYTIPIEGRKLRVAQLGYDTIAASNTPTAEQIHSMLDRSRASALGTPGSSLLAQRFHDVPLLSQAWGIGHIGLPFAQDGNITFMGFELPVPQDTDLVASLRYTTALKLRIQEFAPDASSAQRTVETMNALLSILRGVASAQPVHDEADAAMRQILDSVALEQRGSRAELTASANIAQVKALTSAHPKPSAEDVLPSLATPAPQPASNH
jgi:hypothetical protein